MNNLPGAPRSIDGNNILVAGGSLYNIYNIATNLLTPLSNLPGTPNAISGNNIVGYYITGSFLNWQFHGFLYNITTGNWITLDKPGASGTQPQGISGNSIVGWAGSSGFLYDITTGIWTALTMPGVMSTSPVAIDGNNIVGYYIDASGHDQGFLYDGTTWTTLTEFPGVNWPYPIGISGNKIISNGGISGNTGHGYLYTITASANPVPSIASISPTSGAQGQTIPNFTVTGSNFDTNAMLSFSWTGITVDSYSLRTSAQIVANINILPDSPIGSHNVIVTNPDSQRTTLVGGFATLAENASQEPSWAHTWGGSASDSASSMAIDAGGSIYLAGSTSSFGAGGSDVLLLKYGSSGILLWSRTWGGPGEDYGYAVAVDNAGNVYVAGGTASFGAGWYDALLLKFDSSGNLLWSRTWGGGSFEQAYSIGFDSSGNVYVAAESYSVGDAAVLLKYSPNGDLLLSKAWKGPATYDTAYSLDVDGNGNVYLAGISWDYWVSPYHNTILVLKFDSAGNLVWNRNWAGPGQDEAGNPKSIKVDGAGNVYVAGRMSSHCLGDHGACDFDALLLKLSADGNLLWNKTWRGSSGYDTATGLAFEGNGNLVVSGVVDMSSSFSTAMFLRYDPNGNLLSSKSWGGNVGVNSSSLGLDQSGNIFIAGSGPNNVGGWQDTTGSSATEGGIFSSQSATVASVVGTLGSPTGTLTMPTGIIDIGGGGVDAFVAKGGTSTAPQPQISITPASLSVDFGSVAVGGTKSLPITIQNTGTADLNITGITTLSGPFTVSPQAFAPISPGNSVQLSVTFNALFGGAANGTLTISSNAPTPSTNVSLSGTGTVPLLTNMGPSGNSAKASDPVNTATGNYFYQHTDLMIPSRGLPFVFQRTYNALNSNSGPLGAGWTHSYDISLSTRPDGLTTVEWSDGHDIFYVRNSDGTFTPSLGGTFDTLVQNADGSFTLTQKNQTQLIFTPAGKLSTITDKNGNSLVLSYDGVGNLSQITDTAGRVNRFGYDSSNHIVLLTDPVGRVVGFGYDSAGDLISSTDPDGGITSYAYDASHRVTSITLPNGKLLLQNTYDSASRVVSQTNGRAFVTTFAYDTPGSGQTTITDPRGGNTIHTHDSLLRLLQITDALGGTTGFTYDANNNRTSATNQNGSTTNFTNDPLGNVTSITDPYGRTTSFTYDAKNNLFTATNAKGKTTSFTYDVNGNLKTIQDALSNTTAFAYDGVGQLTSKTDARGNVTTFSYDSFGNLSQITDALNHSTTLACDGIGRLLSITDPNGHKATATYDALSRLEKITDPLSSQTRIVYDAVGNLLTITDANGNATNYAYDANNNLVSVTDALGHVTQYGYDANNNRETFTNAKGDTTSYAYDALNRLMSVTDPLSFVTSYVYDAVGNVVAVTDAKGQTNRFHYNALNRLVNIAYADANYVTYFIDANGKPTKMLDVHGYTLYNYDALDRLISATYRGGKVVTYAYDGVGNRQSVTYPDGKVVSYSFDPANRIAGVTDWLGRATTYSYDAANNLTRTSYPNQAALAFAYDAANRLVQVRNSYRGSVDNPVTSFTYALDPVGNRLQVTDGSGKTTSYGYDPLYQLTSVAVDTKVTRFTYDSVGNRLSLTAPGTSINYTYDAADRLLTAGTALFTYDANGNQTSKTQTGTGNSLIYSYDAANRLTSVTGGAVSSAFAYDGEGNRITQSVGTGTYSYLNDVATALPVVLQESGPDGDISYAYGLGLISESGPAFDFFYHYDGLGSVVGLTDPAGKLAGRYVYDAWGQPELSAPGPQLGTRNKFRFTGEALDPGTGLYFLRTRFYDPNVGRLTSKDPFRGLVILPLTQHRFLYAHNNPVLLADHSGLAPDSNSPQVAFLWSPTVPRPLPTTSPATGETPGQEAAKNAFSCIIGLVITGIPAGCVENLLEDKAQSIAINIFVKDPQTRSDINILMEPSFFNPPSETVAAQLRILDKVNRFINHYIFGTE
ncbi:MAG: DUF6531 domain-containing protein [Acidobacteriia bacterium]|nr:DUF6531 domain-containing protein [Terriglobia bacterium]